MKGLLVLCNPVGFRIEEAASSCGVEQIPFVQAPVCKAAITAPQTFRWQYGVSPPV